MLVTVINEHMQQETLNTPNVLEAVGMAVARGMDWHAVTTDLRRVTTSMLRCAPFQQGNPAISMSRGVMVG